MLSEFCFEIYIKNSCAEVWLHIGRTGHGEGFGVEVGVVGRGRGLEEGVGERGYIKQTKIIVFENFLWDSFLEKSILLYLCPFEE